MKAEIIAVGTELLMGQIANTNAQYISQRLPEVGIGVYYHSVIGDNPQCLKEALKTAMSRCDVIIMTGGLGPTQDDLTKETVAEMFGLEMVFDEVSAQNIKNYFNQIGRDMVESNLRQAYFPKDSIILYNDKGTAPGCIIEGGNTIIMLPGPPSEMQPMFTKSVLAFFNEKCTERLSSAFVKIAGLGESSVEERLMPLINAQTNPTFATYAKTGDVTLRITASAQTEEESKNILSKALIDVKQYIGKNIYSIDNEDIEQVVIRKFTEKGMTLATAESCTGGLIAQKLTDVPGASAVVGYGFVTYSNEAKNKLLGVDKGILEKYGAVSSEVASEMCDGLKNVSCADVCVSVTGIAGPGGGTAEKPVGLVYVGIKYKEEKPKVFKCNFSGTRERIRTLTVIRVMEELLKLEK